MKRSLPLCGILLGVGVLPFAFSASRQTTPDPDPLSAPVLAPDAATRSCKPDAPVRVDVFPRDLVGGNARVDYELTPVMDVLDLEVEVVFPQGGQIRWHIRPNRGPAERLVSHFGAVSADLPAGLSGVELEIRAHVSIPDQDAPGGVGVYTTTRTVTWGEVDRIVDGVTEVTTDGEITLDTAATRF